MLRYCTASGVDHAPHRVPQITDTVSAQASQTATGAQVASLGGDLAVTQQLPAVGAAVTAFWAYLTPGTGARGPVIATLRTGTNATATSDIVDVESVDASHIPAAGGWVKFAFLPPLGTTLPSGGYVVTLSAPASPANTIAWSGVHSQDAKTTDPTYGLIKNNALDDEGLNPAYDTLTNSFTAEALHELAPIAQSLGDATRQGSWSTAADSISAAIAKDLTTTVDNTTTYAEKYAITSSGTVFSRNYSFADIAPIAAGWYKMDPAVMANTVAAYRKHAATTFGTSAMLEAMSSSTPTSYLSTDGGKGIAWVLAKSLGWEMAWYGSNGDSTLLAGDEAFLKAEWPDATKPVAEGWTKDTDGTVHTSDPGNQEHASWFVYELLTLYPQLAATLAPPTAPAHSATGPVTGYSGVCLDVRRAGTADGTPVQIYHCNSTPAQSWTAEPDGTLQALGKCLQVSGGGKAHGTIADLYHCDGTGAEQWIPQTNGELLNPQSGMCLDDPAYATTDSTQVAIWDCNNGDNQHWKLP